jgi:hypothetical protein
MVAPVPVPFGSGCRGRHAWQCHGLDHEGDRMMLPHAVI